MPPVPELRRFVRNSRVHGLAALWRSSAAFGIALLLHSLTGQLLEAPEAQCRAIAGVGVELVFCMV